MHSHDSERLNFFGMSRKFNISDGGYAKVVLPEIITLKDNANIKRIVDDEGQLLINACGNTLLTDKPYHQLSCISIQLKIKRRKAHFFTNIINHILFTSQNCYLCENNVVIDSEVQKRERER